MTAVVLRSAQRATAAVAEIRAAPEAQMVPRICADAADDFPPPLLQQDRGLRRVQTVADRAHRAGVDLCAGHRSLAPMVRATRAACATAAPASKSRIRSNLDGRIRCCYMSAAEHEECLVLVEERDPDGKITVPSGMSFFHTAFELEGNRLEDVLRLRRSVEAAPAFARNYGPVRHNGEPPLGDGETGGNVACYFYDPDYHNVEFCGAMDTIENYRARYGDTKGSART